MRKLLGFIILNLIFIILIAVNVTSFNITKLDGVYDTIILVNNYNNTRYILMDCNFLGITNLTGMDQWECNPQGKNWTVQLYTKQKGMYDIRIRTYIKPFIRLKSGEEENIVNRRLYNFYEVKISKSTEDIDWSGGKYKMDPATLRVVLLASGFGLVVVIGIVVGVYLLFFRKTKEEKEAAKKEKEELKLQKQQEKMEQKQPIINQVQNTNNLSFQDEVNNILKDL